MSDFDCNPLRYLGQSSVHSYGINVYASGGIPRESRFQNEYITEENTIFVQVDEKFYDLKTKSPSSRPSWCGVTEFTLPDKNLLRYVEDSCDELDGYFDKLYETLAISYRPDVSDIPIALVNSKYEDGHWYGDGYFGGPFYRPSVHTYEKNGSSLSEVSNVAIDESNNEYYEDVFQYDINQDGKIPDHSNGYYPIYGEPVYKINGKKIKGTQNNDALSGKNANDLIRGKQGDDILTGRKGHDLLYGGDNNDQLFGSKGKDFLDGGKEDDILEGGKSPDVFKLSEGKDTIVDFNIAQGDRIAIPIEHIKVFAVKAEDGNTIVSVEDYGQLVLAGISVEDITKNNSQIFLRYL